jgi:SAM-dependent methyltransferase
MTRDPSHVMRDFWDAKARENATYYISAYRPYDAQDEGEFWAWGETLTARLLEESGLELTGRERVLDLGCGIGRMTVPLARRFREVVGADVSAEMVRRARETLAPFPHARAEIVNGTDLSGFAAGSFDFVFSYLVLQHVPEPAIVRGCLLEIGRVLAPGGAFHVQVNGEPERGEPLGARLRGAASRALRALAPGEPRGPRGLESPAWRGCRVPLERARAFLAEAGLTLERTRGEGTQYLWLTGRRPEAVR